MASALARAVFCRLHPDCGNVFWKCCNVKVIFADIRGLILNEVRLNLIELKYYEGEPVIQQIKRISTPGRRVYSSVKQLPRVANGLGISILTTPQGVLSDAEAREANVGGEVICQVF